MNIDEEKLKLILQEQRQEYERYVGMLYEKSESKISFLGETLADLKIQFDGMKAELVDIKDQIIDIRIDLAGVKKDVSGLKKDVSGLKKDVSGLKKDVSGLKKDVSGLKKDVSGLKGDMLEVKEKVFINTQDISEIKIEIGEINKKLSRKVDQEEFESFKKIAFQKI